MDEPDATSYPPFLQYISDYFPLGLFVLFSIAIGYYLFIFVYSNIFYKRTKNVFQPKLYCWSIWDFEDREKYEVEKQKIFGEEESGQNKHLTKDEANVLMRLMIRRAMALIIMLRAFEVDAAKVSSLKAKGFLPPGDFNDFLCAKETIEGEIVQVQEEAGKYSPAFVKGVFEEAHKYLAIDKYMREKEEKEKSGKNNESDDEKCDAEIERKKEEKRRENKRLKLEQELIREEEEEKKRQNKKNSK